MHYFAKLFKGRNDCRCVLKMQKKRKKSDCYCFFSLSPILTVSKPYPTKKPKKQTSVNLKHTVLYQH